MHNDNISPRLVEGRRWQDWIPLTWVPTRRGIHVEILKANIKIRDKMLVVSFPSNYLLDN